jgi:hypothetical protein
LAWRDSFGTPNPCHTLLHAVEFFRPPFLVFGSERGWANNYPTTLLLNMTYLPKTLVILASLLAAQAFAHISVEVAAAQARYKREVADCAAKQPNVDKHSCLRDAKNALAEIRRGRMDESTSSAEWVRNALLRCEAHKGEDKSDCIARIQGRGRTVGSVAGGGILRELTTTKTLTTPAVAQPVRPAVPDAPLPSGLMSNCRWVPPSDWVCK